MNLVNENDTFHSLIQVLVCNLVDYETLYKNTLKEFWWLQCLQKGQVRLVLRSQIDRCYGIDLRNVAVGQPLHFA